MEHPGDELTLRELAAILGGRKRFIFTVTLLGLLLALALAMFSRDVFQAEAVVSVSPMEIEARLEDKIQLQPLRSISVEALKSLTTTQKVLLDTVSQLRRQQVVPEKWDGYSDEELAARLRKKMRLQVSGKDAEQGLFTVGFSTKAGDPALAAKMANAWALASLKLINDLPIARLKANLQALEQALAAAEQDFRDAQDAWRGFAESSRIEELRRQLDHRVSRQLQLSQQIAYAEQELRVSRARLAAVREQLEREQHVVPAGAAPELALLSGRKLSEALPAIEKNYQAAARAYRESADALAAFESATPLRRWEQELSERQRRIAAIRVRLSSFETEKTVVRTALEAVRRQLAALPERISLRREVTSDPAITAAAGDVAALKGLSLSNEELNPNYTRLAAKEADLEVALARLEREAGELERELKEHLRAVDGLRKQVAGATLKKERLELAAREARDRYRRLASMRESYRGVQPETYFDPSGSASSGLRTTRYELDAAIAGTTAALEGFKRQSEANSEAIARVKQELAAATLEADRLQEALKLSKQTFLALKQKQADLKIELAGLEDALAQVISPAYPDPEPVAPRRAMILALGTVLGFMMGVIGAFLLAALEVPESRRAPRPAAAPGGSEGAQAVAAHAEGHTAADRA